MSSKQQRRSFWEWAIDVSWSWETWQPTRTVVHTLRVDLNYQNKPTNAKLKWCNCHISNTFKTTMQDNCWQEGHSVFVYKQILWWFHCHCIPRAINLKGRSPPCTIAPLRSLSFLRQSNPWKERKHLPSHTVTPLFCKSSFLYFSLFLLSNIEHLPMVRHTAVHTRKSLLKNTREWKKRNVNKLISTTLC